jgi:hypothetical protein
MKIVLTLLLGVLLTTGVFVAQEAPRHELPAAIQRQLDERFPGWRFPQISDEIREAAKEWVAPNTDLDLIGGDFDGNAEPDYALLVDHGEICNDAGVAIGREVSVVAFLKKGDDYEYHLVDPTAGDYLLLINKGDGRYDYEAQKSFIFPLDAIDSVTFEKAATSYVYEKGKFRAILTGD